MEYCKHKTLLAVAIARNLRRIPMPRSADDALRRADTFRPERMDALEMPLAVSPVQVDRHWAGFLIRLDNKPTVKTAVYVRRDIYAHN
jgi:hypothetical protein